MYTYSATTSELVDITPSVRLLRVLRNSGFNLHQAMGEILDNSIDAGANEIDIYAFVNDKKKKNIMIVDNGKGMNEKTLQESLTLAKELKLGVDELGKFGMGMKTAALSLSTHFEILTKTLSGDLLFGEFNINKMEQIGEFKTNVRRATIEEDAFFKTRVGKRRRSGSIIIIKNCDRFDMSFTTFVKQMQNYIGLTYKSYIEKGVSLSVNDMPVRGKEISVIDPLMLDNEHTFVVAEKESYPVSYSFSNDSERKSVIQVSAVVLPMPDNEQDGRYIDKVENKLPLNQVNQGIYFSREGRIVGQGLSWSNVFGEKHNAKNRFRILINCTSDLDDEIRMNFQKGNVMPTNKLKAQLEKIIEPLMAKMRERVRWEEEGDIEPEDLVDLTMTDTNANVSTSSYGVPETKLESTSINTNDESQGNLVQQERLTTSEPLSKFTQPENISYTFETTSRSEIYEKVLANASKIGKILASEKVPQEWKDKIVEALGFEIEEGQSKKA